MVTAAVVIRVEGSVLTVGYHVSVDPHFERVNSDKLHV